MSRFIFLLVAALTLLPGSAGAQEPPAPQSGAMLRIWTAQTMAPFIGKLVDQNATSLIVIADGADQPVTVRRDAIIRMDMSRGRRTARHSVFTGVLIGAGAALAMGLIAGDDPENAFLYLSPEGKAIAFSIITVPVGALIGAIVGPGKENWTPTSSKLSQTVVAPTPALRFSFRF